MKMDIVIVSVCNCCRKICENAVL